MTDALRLAPHDAELVEADARQLYDETCEAEGLDETWDDAPAWCKAIFRAAAGQPYTLARAFRR